MNSFFYSEDMVGGYGGENILNNCGISVNKGEISVIVGPNGAGKSTAMKAMLGMLSLSHGKVVLDNEEITKLSPQDRVAKGISFVPQTMNIFNELSVKENLRYFMALNKSDRPLEKIDQCAHVFQAGALLEKTFSELSSGQMQLISIMRGILEEPMVLLLDEALVNLDKEMLNIVSFFLENFVSKEGRLVIICSHNVNLPFQFKEVIELS